eukprot:12920332-Prorocentrum_lima.AAC.1
MGSYGDRRSPGSGDQGIQAGHQEQQPEVPTHGNHAPRDQGPEQREQRPVESVENEGVQGPPGIRPQAPNPMTG